jgi:hypothetical protein
MLNMPTQAPHTSKEGRNPEHTNTGFRTFLSHATQTAAVICMGKGIHGIGGIRSLANESKNREGGNYFALLKRKHFSVYGPQRCWFNRPK